MFMPASRQSYLNLLATSCSHIFHIFRHFINGSKTAKVEYKCPDFPSRNMVQTAQQFNGKPFLLSLVRKSRLKTHAIPAGIYKVSREGVAISLMTS